MGIQSRDCHHHTTPVTNTMKFFILSILVAAAVASPALSRDDECPTLEQIGQAFEAHFQVEIPEGILDCVHGGDNCPFSSFEAFFEWFEESTGLQIPDVDVDVEALMDACMSGSEDCPTLDEAVDFLQNELGADLDDETIEGIYNCAGDILSQLGFAKK